MGVRVIEWSQFVTSEYEVLVAIGDPSVRRDMVARLPADTHYTTLLHPRASISAWTEIGEGSLISTGCVVTSNIRLGRHSQLNVNSTIGHDCDLGEFFTAGPGVNLGGNISCGDGVYLGANACVRQGTYICSNVSIGMGGVVVTNIEEAGVYVGNPVRRLECPGPDSAPSTA
jgi:sugar O-acyltransferase (sialic acid O-acetyltransferase NeuD family)